MVKKKSTKNKVPFVQKITHGLENAMELSKTFERLLVDVVAAYVPLFAPVIPATIAFFSLYLILKMPLVVSLIGAGVVEFLGLSTVSTTMEFVDYNASRNDDDPPAPTKAAIGATVFYLIVVLTVNVILDESELIHKAAKLLLSLLSIAGAVTISLRRQQSRRVAVKAAKDAKAEAESGKQKADETAYRRQVSAEKRQQKHELKLKELELKASETKPELVKVAEQVSETSNTAPETFGQFKSWRQLPMEHKTSIAQLVKSETKRVAMEKIVETYLVSERVAYGWIEYAERDYPTVEIPTNQTIEESVQ